MAKIIKIICISILIVLILFFIVFHVLDVRTIIMKKMYPQEYTQYVDDCAEKYNLDQLLIYSIIKIESNFNVAATSRSNAKGLMQLMENTALDVSEQSDIDLYDPETNIELGTHYFSILLKKYNYQLGIALAAYNAGMGTVDNWIKQGIIKEDGSDLENIPYKETNMYVRRILNTYEIYRNLYEQ